MSSGSPGTHTKILEAARALLEAKPPHEVTLAEIGSAAGVSRQSVYLHFGSRAGLLLALVEYVDRAEGLGKLHAHAWSADSGPEMLDRYVEVVAEITPRIDAIALALESACTTDEAAAQAWADRMAGRLRSARRIVERLYDEGVLREEWTVDEATDFVWATLAIHTWRDLVVARGWCKGRYIRHIRQVLRRVLLREL